MKLLDQVRDAARVKHFSYRTEQCYVHWIERFIRDGKSSDKGPQPIGCGGIGSRGQ